MSPLTDNDRRSGREAMEIALHPMGRVIRKFGSGRPPSVSKSTPLAAVALATEQRYRLTGFLNREQGTEDAKITSTAVVVRIVGPKSGHALADTILVEEGKEGQALKTLERYKERAAEFTIVGLMFAVLNEDKKYPVAFLIERTAEGKAALEWAWHRQVSEVLRKPS